MIKTMKRIISLMICLGLMLCALPAMAEDAPTDTAVQPEETAAEPQLNAVVCYVPGGRVNMRQEPNAVSKKIGFISHGTAAKVLENLGDWALVEADHKTGYISTHYLEFYYEGQPHQTPIIEPVPRPANRYPNVHVDTWPVTESTTMYVDTPNKGRLTLRAKPKTGSTSLTSFNVGTEMTVLHRDGEWAYVQVGSRKGFVMLKYLSTVQPQPVDPGDKPVIAVATVAHPYSSFVNLRSTRTTDTNKNILTEIPNGAQVDVLVRDRWYTLVNYNGITGYIVSTYLAY